MHNIYKNLVYTLLLFCSVLFNWGCNVINPTEPTPTYLRVDSFKFEEADLHGITCAWVYYNNNPVGAFDLPFTIPIITSGSGKLQIAPGIAINGRNERPLTYPFYQIDTSTLPHAPGTIINYTPKTKYFSAVNPVIISDFEAGQTKFAKWGGTVGMVPVSADSLVFEGTGSGAIFFNAAGDSSIDSTTLAFAIPNGASFIEFTYKSDVQFALGLQAYLSNGYASTQYYIAGVNPSGTWRKFYMNTTAFVTQYPADKYNLFIKAVLPTGQANGRVLIDNIKLVTF